MQLPASAGGSLLDCAPAARWIERGARRLRDFTGILGRHAFEIYEHKRDFEEVTIQKSTAQSLLDAQRARAVVGSGTSRCVRLAPGFRFTLDEHTEPSFNGEFVVVTLEHEGHAGHRMDVGEAASGDTQRAAYENSFSCAPSSVPVRPRRHPDSPSQVVEVAVVTGPPGEDVYTDEFGRIKVRSFRGTGRVATTSAVPVGSASRSLGRAPRGARNSSHGSGWKCW